MQTTGRDVDRAAPEVKFGPKALQAVNEIHTKDPDIPPCVYPFRSTAIAAWKFPEFLQTSAILETARKLGGFEH